MKQNVVSRFGDIDVLRGLSILAVVLLHTKLRMSAPGHLIGASLPNWLSYLIFNNGVNGVTVFFAVSGFLITLVSVRRFGSLAQMRPKAFYRIRFARIAPLLLLLLVLLSGLHLLGLAGFQINPQRTNLVHALFAAVTFHLNWLEATRGYLPPNWDVLWSLSIEEMFYLFFPLMCLGLLRFRLGASVFVALLLIFVAMGPLARTVWTTNEIWQEKSYLSGMDAIALGCLFALLTNYLLRPDAVRGTRQPNLLIAVEVMGAALILLIACWPRWSWVLFLGRNGLDGTLLALATCLVMIASVLHGGVGGQWTAPFRWFGRHSYEVYLTHEFVVVWGAALYLRFPYGPVVLWILAIVALSAILGALVARYFSEPLNRILRAGRLDERKSEERLGLVKTKLVMS